MRNFFLIMVLKTPFDLKWYNILIKIFKEVLMKKLFFLTFLCLSFTFFSFADYVVLNLKNVHCERGAKVVEKALLSVSGVEEVKIDVKKAICQVKYDPSKTNPKALVEEVNKTNYKAEIQGNYSCPSIGVKEIDDFHNVLHLMHEAINEKKFEIMKENITELINKSEDLKKYANNLFEKAKSEEEKIKCEEIKKLTELVFQNANSLKISLQKGKEEEILKDFDILHTNFYKILEKSE